MPRCPVPDPLTQTRNLGATADGFRRVKLRIVRILNCITIEMDTGIYNSVLLIVGYIYFSSNHQRTRRAKSTKTIQHDMPADAILVQDSGQLDPADASCSLIDPGKKGKRRQKNRLSRFSLGAPRHMPWPASKLKNWPTTNLISHGTMHRDIYMRFRRFATRIGNSS